MHQENSGYYYCDLADNSQEKGDFFSFRIENAIDCPMKFLMLVKQFIFGENSIKQGYSVRHNSQKRSYVYYRTVMGKKYN